MQRHSVRAEDGWRTVVFKNRGLLLVPVALIFVLLGSPSVRSAAAGIAIAAVGELMRIWAVGYSGPTTRADAVTAPKLVTAGPYAYVRNPLYLGNAIIALGFWLAFSGNVPLLTSLAMLAVTAILIVCVYGAIIPLEESYLADAFGGAYQRYSQAVPRLVPVAPLPLEQRQGEWHPSTIFRAEAITLAYFILMMGAVIVKIWAAR